MKILIDLTCLTSNITGVGRYAKCISQEMLKIDKENDYVLLFQDSIDPSFLQYIDNKKITSYVIKNNNNIFFKLIKLPFSLYKIKADKYLFLYSKGPLFFYNKNIYNTIHDLVCWDYPNTMSFPQMLHSRSLNIQAKFSSKKIITVSNFTKERIVKLLKFPEDKILVSYEGTFCSSRNDHSLSYYEVKHKYNLPDNYILSLSTLEPRKNLQLLLKAYNDLSNQLDYDLVLVGKKGWKIKKTLNNIQNNNRIHITGYVSDEEAIEIYKHSKCFVFPSLYEGFGLPPLEALSLGTPVISSNGTSLPEILRNQARYFENNSLSSLKNELQNLEKNINSMPKSLDYFQKENYNFYSAAKKIINILNEN